MEVKVKQIEKFKIDKENTAFLIKRFYKKELINEYVVCLNYDFKHNIYTNGIVFQRLMNAYQFYNYLSLHGELPLKDGKDDSLLSDQRI